jgi:putative chitobiose transport system substrate-binding protein
MRIGTGSGRDRRGLAGRAVAILVAVALISACVGKDGSDDGGAGNAEKATLAFWTINLKKNFNGYVTDLITKYQAAHPGITIEWVDVPGADIATKLLSALASGDTPDVVNIDSTNLGPFADKLTDLGAYFDGAALADYQPGLVDSLRFNGTLRAIPWYNGGAPVGIYNMDIMSKVGFDRASPPKSYDDVLRLAQSVYDKTQVYGTNALPSFVSGQWSILAYEGITMLSPDKQKAAFNTPEAAAVLAKYKKAYDAHAIAPGSVSQNVRAFEQTLDNRKIAFQADAFPFVLTSLEKNAPNIYKNVVVTKAPTTKDGKYLLLSQQTFAIPAASKHRAAAANFVKYLTNGENQLAFCKLVAIYPSTVSTTKDAFFTASTDTSPIGQARKVILAELPDLVDGRLGTGKDAQLSEALSNQVRAYLSGSVSAEQALSAAAEAWDKALAAK